MAGAQVGWVLGEVLEGADWEKGWGEGVELNKLLSLWSEEGWEDSVGMVEAVREEVKETGWDSVAKG